ncbi:MAG TPA: acetylxylan esterase [Bryobacteraceae bacterium]|jgi:cephalosporin-C deacetylase-like acetyl esterase
MNTRRGFLRASSCAVAGKLAQVSVAGREALNAQPAVPTSPVRDYWNDFPHYLTSVVNAARVRRKAALSKIRTRMEADERAAFVRSKIWELIGGLLEKTPLSVKTTGIVERGAYRIEKLIIESQPQFYAPAHFYLPKGGGKPFPCILAPLGHTNEGKLYRSYQIVFQNLARKGFAVFTWDPPGQGERLQYPIPGTNRSRFGPTGEHEQFGWPALLIGSTTTQFEVWDAIRALDYLATRREVDMSRIGCCGHSGGGTLTMYLCSLEPRIQAAVVVEGHTENVAGAHYEPPGAYADAEQNIIGSLKLGLDRGDLLSSFAPKPLLLCYTHMDVGSTYSAHYEQGTREIFQESKDIYTLYGASAKVGLSASNLPHDYDFFHRKATYDWFNRWLGGSGDSSEAEFDGSPDSALLSTSTGQILTSLGGRTAYQVNRDRLRQLETSRHSPLDKREVRRTLRELLALPPRAGTVRSAVLSTSTYRNLTIEEFEVYSEPSVRVPGWFLKPSAASSKLPVVLMVSNGKNRIFDNPPLLSSVTQKNIALCAIDIRALGQATPRLPSSGPLFYGHGVDMAYSLVSLTAGIPLTGQRTWDILCCLDYLHARPDVGASRIGLFGSGAPGLEALYAAALDDRFHGLLLDHTLSDFQSLVAAEDYSLKVGSFTFGLLKHFDLPQLASVVLPRPLWLSNPVDPKGDAVPMSVLRTTYPETAEIRIESPQTEAVFEEWVAATLL